MWRSFCQSSETNKKLNAEITNLRFKTYFGEKKLESKEKDDEKSKGRDR